MVFGREMRYVVAGGLAVLVAAAGLAAIPSQASGEGVSAAVVAQSPSPSGTVSEEEAEAEAARTGQRVEVTAERNARETLYAHADGTRTLEISAEPMRTREDGGWVDIDTTLQLASDGRVEPVAAATSMSFSGGGTDAFAELAVAGATLRVSFPAELPEPVLEGNTAKYVDVFDGVDLVVHAEAESFSHVLVVKDAAAALNPALEELRFPVESDGEIAETGDGGLEVRDATGRAALAGQPPVMWDSRGEPGAAAAQERLAQPQAGDGIGRIGLEVDDATSSSSRTASGSSTEMVLRPNLDMLTGAETEYPVIVDPRWDKRAPENGAWAMVFKQHPNMEFFKWSGTQGVGYQTYNGVSKKRLFWRFSSKKIRGKQILKANFKAYETHSASCTKTWIKLYRTGLIDRGTNWNNQPNWIRHISSKNVAWGRSGCDPDGRWVKFDATLAAKIVSKNNLKKIGLGLRAANESNNLSWKRFRRDALFAVRYNTPPKTPAAGDMRLDDPSAACETTTADRPTVPLQDTTLKVSPRDADGHQVRVQFEIYKTGKSDGEDPIWARNYPVNRNGARFQSLSQAFEPKVSRSLFDDGQWYMWRARVQDRLEDGSRGEWTKWGARCKFEVDGSIPPAPRVVAPGEHVRSDGDLEYEASQTAELQFEPCDPAASDACAGDPDDVAGYVWSLGDERYDNQAPKQNGAWTAHVDFPTYGKHQLYVKAVDAVGHKSAERIVMIHATAEEKPRVASFGMTEGEDQSTVDGIDTTRALSWSADPGVVWLPGSQVYPDAPALGFTGTTQSVPSTTSTVVPTASHFTIGAWLRPEEISGDAVAVSQRSSDGSGFELGVDHSCAVGDAYCLAFTVFAADGTSHTVTTEAADGWDWTYLAGVYSPGTSEISLWQFDYQSYQAELVGTESGVEVTLPASDGVLQVGGVTGTGGAVTRPWVGGVSDISVYGGAFTDENDVSQAATVG